MLGSALEVEVVMTLFFQHPRPPSFVRTANQMTSEMGMRHSGFSFGASRCALGWSYGVHGGCRCPPSRFSAGRRFDR